MIDPVYPKSDPEFRKQIMEEFYKKVRETNWDALGENEYQGKPRGRKPKPRQSPPPEYYKPKEKRHDNFKDYISLAERDSLWKKN